VVIVSANGTEDRGFKSRQSVIFLGLYTYIALLFIVTNFTLLLFAFEWNRRQKYFKKNILNHFSFFGAELKLISFLLILMPFCLQTFVHFFVLIGLAPTRAVDTKISLCPNHFSCLLFKICTFEISRVTKKEQQSYIFLD
jgi:hypothetical protein